MTKREKMSPIDTAWLRMDRPSNLMMIVGVLSFDRSVDFYRLRRVIEQRLASRFRRFRQRVEQDPLGAWWTDDVDFDLDNHLLRRALPAPAGKEELQQLASELATEPLHASRPLWRFDFIENYNGGSALIARIHHCIADGIALIGVMLSMTDLSADAANEAPIETPTGRKAESIHPWHALMDPITQATSAAIGLSTRFWVSYLDLATNPEKMLKLGGQGLGFAGELGKLLAMPADSRTRLKGRTGTRKRVAWCDPLPLAEVKAIGKVLGCSVNDVLLSAVAGAIRAYLLARGEAVEGVEIRALVPVNLRSPKDEGKLGNRFGMVTLLLPIYEGNPLARLFEVRRRMNAMKGSFQPPLTMLLLGIAGIAPKLVQEKFLDMLANKASAVMTNVPGPRQPLYLAGGRIEQIMFWVPQSGDIGVGVSILSYNDAVQFGLITDRRFVPDPEALTPLFADEFEKMLMGLLLHDWQSELDPHQLENSLSTELNGFVEDSALVRRRQSQTTPDEKRRRARLTRTATSTPSTQPSARTEKAGGATPLRIPKRFRAL